MATIKTMTARPRPRRRRPASRAFLYALLLLGAFLSAFPFYWMLVLSTQSSTAIFHWPPPLLPGPNLMANYRTMIELIPFWRNLFNSAFVAITQTALALLLCSMAGYAFALYRFPGREKLFALMLMTMMIPWMAGIVPWFILISKWLHWSNRYEALIIPGAATAFGIFWMRQYIQDAIPAELVDAARIDGCPEFQIFFRVAMPLLGPAYGALGIMTFMGNWNAFMVPLLVMQEKTMYTLPVALNLLRLSPQHGYDAGSLMLGTSMAVLPILVVFLIASRRFMAGLTAGALKG